MGDLKFFNKNLYVILNSFTLQDVRDDLFLSIIGNSNKILNIKDINNET